MARARLAEKTERRRKREQAELEHITDFESAVARRAQAETEMAAAVAGLIGLGNTVADAAELTEQTETEIRRLRKLAAERETSAAEPPPAAANGSRASARLTRDDDGQNTLAFDAAAPEPAASTE